MSTAPAGEQNQPDTSTASPPGLPAAEGSSAAAAPSSAAAVATSAAKTEKILKTMQQEVALGGSSQVLKEETLKAVQPE